MITLQPAGLHGRAASPARHCCGGQWGRQTHRPAVGVWHAAPHERAYRHRLQFLLQPRLRRHCAAGAVRAAAAQQADYMLDPPVTREQLEDPAHIGGKTAASTDVQDRGGETGLNAYMQLPVEQYWTLNPGMIRQLGGNCFALQVPRISLFNVWVEPLVHVSVRLVENDSAVLVRAENWGIRGSELIEKLNLNRRFSLAFTARLSWTPAAASGSGRQTGNGTAAPAAGTGTVHGSLDLDVWSEVIGPFRFLPRSVLEGTGNAVLGTLMSSLLPPFLKSLASDYEKWAMTPEYRAKREQQAAGDHGKSPYE